MYLMKAMPSMAKIGNNSRISMYLGRPLSLVSKISVQNMLDTTALFRPVEMNTARKITCKNEVLVELVQAGKLNSESFVKLVLHSLETVQMQGKGSIKELSPKENLVVKRRKIRYKRMLAQYVSCEIHPAVAITSPLQGWQVEQVERIYSGIAEGLLTRREAVNLLERQERISYQKGILQATGSLEWMESKMIECDAKG